jgi:hypothetical protein
MLAGLLAGVLALAFAELTGEPALGRALAFESHTAGAVATAPLVSRGVQRTAGLATGILVYGAAAGGLFALVFALAYGRVGRVGPRATSALVALGSVVAVILVPFLKYPPNPPSIGNPETIGYRTELYLAMLVISLAGTISAVIFGRRLVPRFGAWNATLISAGVFVALIAVAQRVLPSINEVPPGFPAPVLWQFRLAALGTQLVLWAGIGLVFGAMAERASAGRPQAP